jgi:hypothetical protein
MALSLESGIMMDVLQFSSALPGKWGKWLLPPTSFMWLKISDKCRSLCISVSEWIPSIKSCTCACTISCHQCSKWGKGRWKYFKIRIHLKNPRHWIRSFNVFKHLSSSWYAWSNSHKKITFCVINGIYVQTFTQRSLVCMFAIIATGLKLPETSNNWIFPNLQFVSKSWGEWNTCISPSRVKCYMLAWG